jgi:hypothetical protein
MATVIWFSTKVPKTYIGIRKTSYPHVDPCLSPCKNQHKMDWKAKCKPCLHFSTPEKTLENIGLGSDFLIRTPIVQEISEITDEWDCMESKSFWGRGMKENSGQDEFKYDIFDILWELL